MGPQMVHRQPAQRGRGLRHDPKGKATVVHTSTGRLRTAGDNMDIVEDTIRSTNVQALDRRAAQGAPRPYRPPSKQPLDFTSRRRPVELVVPKIEGHPDGRCWSNRDKALHTRRTRYIRNITQSAPS